MRGLCSARHRVSPAAVFGDHGFNRLLRRAAPPARATWVNPAGAAHRMVISSSTRSDKAAGMDGQNPKPPAGHGISLLEKPSQIDLCRSAIPGGRAAMLWPGVRRQARHKILADSTQILPLPRGMACAPALSGHHAPVGLAGGVQHDHPVRSLTSRSKAARSNAEISSSLSGNGDGHFRRHGDHGRHR